MESIVCQLLLVTSTVFDIVLFVYKFFVDCHIRCFCIIALVVILVKLACEIVRLVINLTYTKVSKVFIIIKISECLAVIYDYSNILIIDYAKRGYVKVMLEFYTFDKAPIAIDINVIFINHATGLVKSGVLLHALDDRHSYEIPVYHPVTFRLVLLKHEDVRVDVAVVYVIPTKYGRE